MITAIFFVSQLAAAGALSPLPPSPGNWEEARKQTESALRPIFEKHNKGTSDIDETVASAIYDLRRAAEAMTQSARKEKEDMDQFFKSRSFNGHTSAELIARTEFVLNARLYYNYGGIVPAEFNARMKERGLGKLVPEIPVLMTQKDYCERFRPLGNELRELVRSIAPQLVPPPGQGGTCAPRPQLDPRQFKHPQIEPPKVPIRFTWPDGI